MKKGVILLIVLLFSISLVFAKEISIPTEGVFPSEASSEESSPVEGKGISGFGDSEVTNYYIGGELLASEDDSGEKVDYIQDRILNNRLVIQNGKAIGDIKNLPFGQELKNNANARFSFGGKELDKDLYYFNARYYDSDLGKFLEVDSIKNEIPYAFVSNNPMNLIDPSGNIAVREGSPLGRTGEDFDNWWNAQFSKSLGAYELGWKYPSRAIQGMAYLGTGSQGYEGEIINPSGAEGWDPMSQKTAAIQFTVPAWQKASGRFGLSFYLTSQGSKSVMLDNPSTMLKNSRMVSFAGSSTLNGEIGMLFTPYRGGYAEGLWLNVQGPNYQIKDGYVEGDVYEDKPSHMIYEGTTYTQRAWFGGVSMALKKGVLGGLTSLEASYAEPPNAGGPDVISKKLSMSHEMKIYRDIDMGVGASANWLQVQGQERTFSGVYHVKMETGPIFIRHTWSPHTQVDSTIAGMRFSF